MDITFNIVLEGTRQYFLGVPKQVQGEGAGQPTWPAGGPPHSEGTPALSGVPAPSSRPPSAAAAASLNITTAMASAAPPRPPSEPLEPEPHIIHKATVMREAEKKRRELPEPEDDEEPVDALSPPSHIIRKLPLRALPSPAPAPAAPCPSPARPQSDAPLPPLPAPDLQTVPAIQYRSTTVRPHDQFTPGRPPDPYSVSRPPEQYVRYYDPNLPDNHSNRNSQGSLVVSPQPSVPPRHSPQSYARMTNSMPSRLRDTLSHSPPAQRFTIPPTQPPPHNDRVPPIHHPQTTPSSQRLADTRTAHMYPPVGHHRRDTSPYGRIMPNYDRHVSDNSRKYDHQQAYPGYRPIPNAPQTSYNIRPDHHQHKPAIDHLQTHNAAKPPDHILPQQPHKLDAARMSSHGAYRKIRNPDHRNNYQYHTTPNSLMRYPTNPSVSTVLSSIGRTTHHPSTQRGDHSSSSQLQTSPSRARHGYNNSQSRLTVSVTSIVNQMNQTKQKRVELNREDAQINREEKALDLSVKTVKNTADSSTPQDDLFDSVPNETKISLTPTISSTRQVHDSTSSSSSHKVDFSPNFFPYRRERNKSHSYNTPQTSHQPVQYNGLYGHTRPTLDSSESRQMYSNNKYNAAVGRSELVPRIDLTKSTNEELYNKNRTRDDRNFIKEERKRPCSSTFSNIPEKLGRYDNTPVADSRSDRISRSAREQQELMTQLVYRYDCYKQYDKGQIKHYDVTQEHSQVPNYAYNAEQSNRQTIDYQTQQYPERHDPHNNQCVIKRNPSSRDQPSVSSLETHNGIPADKAVLSILRNNLETRHTNYMETIKPAKKIPDLIVIDDVDDAVIEITDDNDSEEQVKTVPKPIRNPTHSNLNHNIQIPKAVDSICRESDYQPVDNVDHKSKSPENDVASRIRTKAELKVMPPTQDSVKPESRKEDIPPSSERVKLLPKSQKQHLFNQIREDRKLESVIKIEKFLDPFIPEIKAEPMNIEEIEKDATAQTSNEIVLEKNESQPTEKIEEPSDDLDWTVACNSFMEQLKTGCHKKKIRKKRLDTLDNENEISDKVIENCNNSVIDTLAIKQEPVDHDELINETKTNYPISQEVFTSNTIIEKLTESNENKGTQSDIVITDIDHITDGKKCEKIGSDIDLSSKNFKELTKNVKSNKLMTKHKSKSVRNESPPSLTINSPKKGPVEREIVKTVIKEEIESTDDDEPLIKSKILKEKERSERLRHQLLKDLSEKSPIVKLECCDVDMNKNSRKSIESLPRDNDKLVKSKSTRQTLRLKCKSLSIDNNLNDKQKTSYSSDSDYEDINLVNRLRTRKIVKAEDGKSEGKKINLVKLSPSKKFNNCNSGIGSTLGRKPGFGDGSDFHPGWEEELYRYKRSLRMPTRLIAIPRGRSGGPYIKGSSTSFTRGSTSLPDLDTAPLSPAPSSAPSVVTDDLYPRRPDKLTLDSDLDSNSSCSVPNRLHYDSEASTSTILSSTNARRRGKSIVDVLIQKCGRKEESKKKFKDKEKEDKIIKPIPKKSDTSELLPIPSLSHRKNNHKLSSTIQNEKLIEDIFYLRTVRKKTVNAFKNAFLKDTTGLTVTEEFTPIVYKSRTRTESKVLKQRATMKEVFGDERPASAPPMSCGVDNLQENQDIDTSKESESKPRLKPKKIVKDKLQRRSSSIRDGLRSTKSLKRNDAKGRLLRLKKRNNLIKSIGCKRIKVMSTNKQIQEETISNDDGDKSKEESSSLEANEVTTKRRFKRLFGRRKLSSGFDYIRKKKKIIRREESSISNKIRKPANKPSPESVHDIQKEIKSWFINKSIGETHLHRAAKLGYTDCVAYCLEQMEVNPSAKDNAGFTPLHVASAKGYVRIARLLLQYGADVSSAAQGGIRPLHEACENCHVEVIRLLLSYGADPLLVTYADQTPQELADGPAALLLRLHIADVQGHAVEPWRFPPPSELIDRDELGYDSLASPPPASPPPPPDAMVEIQCSEAPLPPFYSLRTLPGQPSDGLWCLLQDITNILQIKSKDSLLKQIHCGSGSPKELLREIRTQEFLERAQCHQLLCAGEKVNVRASKVSLVRVTDKLRQLLKIETVLVS